ncbi:tyrosine-type recombinase/integrase [Mycobacterium intracellulare]|uniref:tyrosine-type recombinase/integrase n=1 Tax=Mycobacterium intracellulare TaxID=1767 RepID=UPI002594EA89|nr:site-specific integrase [Mycobacterium intracellulare]MDM3894804.1 tyrosine-type recombinase/integrase [Mycobacterium intracellulare]
MASIRPAKKPRRDGRMYWSVLYRLDGKQRSTSWYDEADAKKFKTLVETIGPADALRAVGLTPPEQSGGVTVGQWLDRYIQTRTGVEQYTIDKYKQYARDIKPILGDLPLEKLTEEDIAGWVRHLETTNSSRGTPRAPKTIKNMHGFLSGALATAVPRHIAANPAAGRRLPRGSGDDIDVVDRLLSHDEFNRLHAATTDYWKPLVEFMVASGFRWGEVSALQPADVDRANNTVRVRRAWKYSSAGYTVGPPKTKRSRRTVDIPATVLDKLDYTHEWLFTNRDGGPVRYPGFRDRVWDPAVKRAGLDPAPTPHALRHTCGSWMLNAGVPIPVVSRHLGHESIQVTVDIYGHLDRRSAQAAADAIAAALG